MPTTITFRACSAALAAALLTVAACSAEQQDWRAAEAAGTSEAYKHFLEQHPESELAGKARERVGEFAEDRDWQEASKLGTADAYRAFLASHPDGRWSQEARIRVESFALGSIPRMEPQMPGQTASRPAGVKLLRLASASSTVPAGALPEASAGSVQVPTSYAIQLGAFGTSGSANREWQHLRMRFGPQLSGLSPQIVRAGSSLGELYRLQARTGSEAQARSICSALKAQSQPCVPVLPH
ncbi:MAG TPA: SPOR domain-containing protein [Steroidobacteraceae bacterium]|nr:SPOR domain-containing protein [Steroidobacteraceae bacterium]